MDKQKLTRRLTELIEETAKVRGKLERIEAAERKPQIEKWIGKCIKTQYSWVKIHSYNYKACRYNVTEITKYEDIEDSMTTVSINHYMFESTLLEEGTTLISNYIFIKKLEEVKKLINNIK